VVDCARRTASPMIQWPCDNNLDIVEMSTGKSSGECFRLLGRHLRRCRYQRSLTFLGKEAWLAYKKTAHEVLALSFVFFQRELDFDSDLDFVTMEA
jgi:hypothetical protein